MWQNEPRLDLREWGVGQGAMKLTKRGICLKMHQVKTLSTIWMESIKENMEKNEEMKWHLGFNVYVSVRENNPCVDIRQYWKLYNDSVPTKKGLCLRSSTDIFVYCSICDDNIVQASQKPLLRRIVLKDANNVIFLLPYRVPLRTNDFRDIHVIMKTDKTRMSHS